MTPEYSVKLYTILNQRLYAVERLDGFIYKYCETRERAEQVCKELNGESK
jgi:hypothetical protein